MESNKSGSEPVGPNTPTGSSPILKAKNFDDGGESNDRPPPMITQSDDDDSSDDKDENNDGKPPPIARRRSTQLLHPENAPISGQCPLFGVGLRSVRWGWPPLPREWGGGTTTFVLPWYRRPQVSSEALPVRARRSLWRRGPSRTLARHSLGGHYGKDSSFKTIKKLGRGYTHTHTHTRTHTLVPTVEGDIRTRTSPSPSRSRACTPTSAS